MHEKVCHLHYCRVKSESNIINIVYLENEYQILFDHADFNIGKGFIIRWEGDTVKYISFLQWLSVYIGEDLVSPFQELDTRFNWYRGDFPLDEVQLGKFFACVGENESSDRFPKWKIELRENSVMYYMMAVGTGIRFMPMNIGFFALSLECIGNFQHGRQDKHWTLGERKFLGLLTDVMEPYKKNPVTKEGAKAFEQIIHQDINLINDLRNAFYGHSLMHLEKDRHGVIDALRRWAVRYGLSKDHAELILKYDDIKSGISSNIPALYKLGLRINRMFLFLGLGIIDPPFATHDNRYLGDFRDDEVSEHKGIRTTTRSKMNDDGTITINFNMESIKREANNT